MISRTKCDSKSEEVQIKEEMDEMFPNYLSIDFSDFQEDDTSIAHEQTRKSDDKISYDDLKFVVHLHTDLVKNFTHTEWLHPEKNKNVNYDFVSPILDKNQIFGKVFMKKIQGLEYTMDKKVIGSLSVLLTATSKYGDIHEIG